MWLPLVSSSSSDNAWQLFSDADRLFSKSKEVVVPHSPLKECARVYEGEVIKRKYNEHSVLHCTSDIVSSEIVKFLKYIAEPLFSETFSKLCSAPREININCIITGDWLFVFRTVDTATCTAFCKISDKPADLSIRCAVAVMNMIGIKKVEAGSTNHVFHLHHPKLIKTNLLLRIYGSCDGVGDRDREEVAMNCMSSCGLGPKLLARWHWGRIEEFIEDAVTCTTGKIISSPILQMKIFEQIKVMHQLPFSELLPQAKNRYSLKGVGDVKSPEEYFEECTKRTIQFLSGLTDADSYYSCRLEIKAMEDNCPTSLERTCLRFLRYLFRAVEVKYRTAFENFFLDEIVWLRNNLRNSESPTVFSHNDLNAGNILIKEKSTCALNNESYLFFVDYEYTDANYRAFDIGNGICELDYSYDSHCKGGFCKPIYMAGKDDNLPREFPRLPKVLYECWKKESIGRPLDEERFFSLAGKCLTAIKTYYFGTSESVLTECHLREVFLGMLSSHLFYSMWSFLMGASQYSHGEDGTSNIKIGLDYMDYGECRIKEYLLLKKWLFETKEIMLI